jgi:tRNA-specific 2-thiouridylase
VKGKKVFVAMSGGVDSSIAAALLKEQGYEVIGVTMQIWPSDQPHPEVEGSCCSLSAVEDARRVAQLLDIPYYVMNFRELFAEKVIEPFCAEYVQGRTPNPCIACNQFIKFEAFLKKTLALGADYMATGHYAKIFYRQDLGRYCLAKAADDKKDQTYALYGFTQHQLAHTLLPLGDYTKPEIRRLAEKINLRVADKPDSQEICFVANNDYKEFLKEKGIAVRPGPFLDTKGNRLGSHEGIAFYTIGQRKGLGIALGKPMYVVDIDVEKNAVILGENDEVFGQGLISINNNFIAIADLVETMEVEAKVRYAAKPAKAVISPLTQGQVKVSFESSQRAITPGQAVVFYQGELVVGGGTILKQARDA